MHHIVHDCRGVSGSESLPEPGRLQMPGEWAARRATWLGWPSNRETWPEAIRPAVERTFVQMTHELCLGEEVHLLVGSHGDRPRAEAALGTVFLGRERTFLHDVAIDDSWLRDSGPIFVRDGETNSVAVVDWDFNKWGGKYPPWDKDDAVPAQVAEIRSMERWIPGMVLEGGSIESDGEGTGLTTRQCLLNGNRNPKLSREAIEERLHAFLGFEKTLWLGRGILGDDTDGHVDDICRFLAPGLVCAAVEEDPNDGNHLVLSENLAELRRLRDARGRRLEVVELPMPRPVVTLDLRTPASYCNFLICARGILLPVFGDPCDEVAISRLEAATGCEIIPVDCRALVFGQGAIHCSTQHEPS
jgi:agmatine deiminase